MYLLDTNIWLERLLEQERSGDVARFLERVSGDQLSITDFSLHSIAVLLVRLKQTQAFLRFLEDIFNYGGVRLINLLPQDMEMVAKRIEEFNLDFDDAYQYAASEKHGLILVGFDKDFERTLRKAKTPAEILTG